MFVQCSFRLSCVTLAIRTKGCCVEDCCVVLSAVPRSPLLRIADAKPILQPNVICQRAAHQFSKVHQAETPLGCQCQKTYCVCWKSSMRRCWLARCDANISIRITVVNVLLDLHVNLLHLSTFWYWYFPIFIWLQYRRVFMQPDLFRIDRCVDQSEKENTLPDLTDWRDVNLK